MLLDELPQLRPAPRPGQRQPRHRLILAHPADQSRQEHQREIEVEKMDQVEVQGSNAKCGMPNAEGMPNYQCRKKTISALALVSPLAFGLPSPFGISTF